MQPTQPKQCNPNIACNVRQCRYNDKMEDHCTLSRIDVQQDEPKAVSEHGTCCHSFECR